LIKECLAREILSLAKQSHEEYRKFKRRGNPSYVGKEWEQLSDDIKYSNIRQVEGIETKLECIGAYITDDPNDPRIIHEFDETDRETLSKKEHELWVEEREETGWIYGGREPDYDNRISPYLVPWEQLNDKEIIGLDYNITDTLIPMLESRNVYVCKMDKPTDLDYLEKYCHSDEIPLVISVVGHTDILEEDVQMIEDRVESLVSTVRNRYGIK